MENKTRIGGQPYGNVISFDGTTSTYLPFPGPGEDSSSCPGCGGSGIQHSNKDGMNHTCPVCGGTGKKSNFNNPWDRITW